MPLLGHFLLVDEPSLLERIQAMKNASTKCGIDVF
jgi:hypothetical protein